MISKQNRIDFIKEYGFKNISDFAKHCKEDVSNMHKVFDGAQKPEVKKCITMAAVCGCSIEQILVLFYEKEMNDFVKEHNRKIS